jgi:hypothetical protein
LKPEPRATNVDEEIEEVTDGAFAPDRVADGQMLLDVVAVAPAFLPLDDVAGFDQVGDDGERRSIGDAERGTQIA